MKYLNVIAILRGFKEMDTWTEETFGLAQWKLTEWDRFRVFHN